MKKNFTKGEWKIGRQGTVVSDTIPENHSNSGHTDVEYYGGYLIAESIVNKADAKLIAAAPDMYNALEHITEYWNRDRNDEAMHNALWHIIETAENVLKKATE